MLKKSLLMLLTFHLAACQQVTTNTTDERTPNKNMSGVTFIEQVSKQADQTNIPYQKYQLDNGLTLILHQDKSDPLVHVDVTYHVGSAREDIGKSGFAHFFEHMMFQGSEHVADEQHIKIITESGGTMNGTTNRDRTNYYQTVPSNQLEKILWLESDRMGFLLDAVTQEKFEVQRETVKNERAQRIDNKPYGLVYERIDEALYPLNHPYSWQTIGYIEDLNRVNVNDLKAFFLRWYGPNNATLTIGGDIDIEKTLAMVKKYFAPIPKGPDVEKPKKSSFTLNADRYISLEDNINLPLIKITFPTVSLHHKDEAALDLLANILGQGKTSLVYKNLVKNRLSISASMNHPCSELACTFDIYAYAIPNSDKTLADIEKIIRDIFIEYEQQGISDEQLLKAKSQMEAQFIFGLQSVSGKVSQLAANQVFTGDPNYIIKDIARYAQVTKADLKRVYQQYIKNKHSVILSVIPKGQKHLVAANDNFMPAPRIIPKYQALASSDLAIRKTKNTFDRNIMPVATKSGSVELPKMWRETFANGIKVLATKSDETPTTSILINIPAGHYFETTDKAGTASLLAAMLNESTTQRSAEQMSHELQKLGASINISANNKYLAVNINTLSKHLNKTLALAYEKLTQPAFLEQEFQLNKHNAIESVNYNLKNANYLALNTFRQLLNGATIASTPANGSVSSLKNIELQDIKTFYQQYFTAKNSQIISVSNLDKNEIFKAMSIFKALKGKATTLDLNIAKKPIDQTRIYLVNKQDAAQSAIRIGKHSLLKDITGEFYRANLMNFPLGDAFNSRINLNLREDKGYSYGAHSYFSANQYMGFFIVSTEVRSNVTHKAITEIINELEKYNREGINDKELAFMRKAINQNNALKYETPNKKLGFLAQLLEYDLDSDFINEQKEIVSTISKTEINALAKKHIDPEHMVIVVVGDAKTIREPLATLGYPIIDYVPKN